jgi:predicted enzyme related to lactoylglutathione lyase
MKITQHYVALDAVDYRAEAEFWAAVFGGEVRDEFDWDDWLTVAVDGRTVVAVQHAPDHVAPDWPSDDPGRQQLQAHLDIYVEQREVAAAEAEVLALGAGLLRAHEEVTEPEGFRVYADPAGHPFCICW